MRCIILCALTAATLGLSTTVWAEDGQMTVRLDGLNLQSSSGARMALRRIHRASDTFCGMDDRASSLQTLAANRACAKQMATTAVAKLNDPRVTALHFGRPWPSVAAVPVLAAK